MIVGFKSAELYYLLNIRAYYKYKQTKINLCKMACRF